MTITYTLAGVRRLLPACDRIVLDQCLNLARLGREGVCVVEGWALRYGAIVPTWMPATITRP